MNYLLVIPSIDIKDGKAVRVVQGIPDLNCCEYDNDPIELAKLWRAENAKMLHIVDFDATISTQNSNRDIVKSICSQVVIPIVYTGGVRTIEDAERLFDYGVCRIALATLPFDNPTEFEKMLSKYGPSKIVVCIEVIDDEVVTKGRKLRTGKKPIEFALELKDKGVNRFIVTDVTRNGMLSGPNIELSASIAAETNCRVTLSGGIRNKDELMDVQKRKHEGIDSVIIGRALYENRFPCQRLWRVAEAGIFN